MNDLRAGAAKQGFKEPSVLMRSHDDECGLHASQFPDHFGYRVSSGGTAANEQCACVNAQLRAFGGQDLELAVIAVHFNGHSLSRDIDPQALALSVHVRRRYVH